MVFFVILEHFKNMYVNTLTVVWSQDMWEAMLFDVTDLKPDKSAIFNYAFTVLFVILENFHYMEMTDQDMLEKITLCSPQKKESYTGSEWRENLDNAFNVYTTVILNNIHCISSEKRIQNCVGFEMATIKDQQPNH